MAPDPRLSDQWVGGPIPEDDASLGKSDLWPLLEDSADVTPDAARSPDYPWLICDIDGRLRKEEYGKLRALLIIAVVNRKLSAMCFDDRSTDR